MKTQTQFIGRQRHRTARGMTLVEVMVAFCVSGLAVAGIVSGYIFANTSAEKFRLSSAATSQASLAMESMRSAQWDTSSWPPIDQLVASNFPTTVVTLETTAGGTNVVYATNYLQISTISVNPPLRRLHVDCVWCWRGYELFTNSIETCRAPDQ